MGSGCSTTIEQIIGIEKIQKRSLNLNKLQSRPIKISPLPYIDRHNQSEVTFTESDEQQSSYPKSSLGEFGTLQAMNKTYDFIKVEDEGYLNDTLQQIEISRIFDDQDKCHQGNINHSNNHHYYVDEEQFENNAVLQQKINKNLTEKQLEQLSRMGVREKYLFRKRPQFIKQKPYNNNFDIDQSQSRTSGCPDSIIQSEYNLNMSYQNPSNRQKVRKIKIKQNVENFMQIGTQIYHIENEDILLKYNSKQNLLLNLLKNEVRPTEYMLGNKEEIIQQVNFKQLQDHEKRILTNKNKKFSKDIEIYVQNEWDQFYPPVAVKTLSKVQKNGRFVKKNLLHKLQDLQKSF